MKRLSIPPTIALAIGEGATLAISISGGKDSQAMLTALVAEYRQRGWTIPIFAIHAHLGRMEWPQTLAHCERIACEAGVELKVVSRPQGDLLQEMQDRMEKLRDTSKPFWPDAQNRYCTADQKRNQIDKVLRAPHWPDSQNRYCTAHQKVNQLDKVLRGSSIVISAEGLRADESYARAKRVPVSIRRQITATTLRDLAPEVALGQRQEGQRVALTWYPLLDWSQSDVWEACGTSQWEIDWRRLYYRMGWEEEALDGWCCHPAYVFGNQRVSCALCVLASRNDLVNGARHNPELYDELVKMERESRFTFRQDLALEDLQD